MEGDPYPYYERDGTRISIDHNTEEGRAKMVEIWSHEYRRVAQDYVGDVHVSTVFLPIDHGWIDWRYAGPDYRPVLFETMVFGYGDGDDEFQWRYRTEAEALAGHAIILEAVRGETLTDETLPYEEDAS
jgi:hypothetical protein